MLVPDGYNTHGNSSIEVPFRLLAGNNILHSVELNPKGDLGNEGMFEQPIFCRINYVMLIHSGNYGADGKIRVTIRQKIVKKLCIDFKYKELAMKFMSIPDIERNVYNNISMACAVELQRTILSGREADKAIRNLAKRITREIGKYCMSKGQPWFY